MCFVLYVCSSFVMYVFMYVCLCLRLLCLYVFMYFVISFVRQSVRY